MSFNITARNFGLSEIATQISHLGLHTTDPGFGAVPNPGEVPGLAQQTVTITGSPTGGPFTLTYRGHVTVPIAYNSFDSAVQGALWALPSIGGGNVIVTGGPGPDTPYVVTFTGVIEPSSVELLVAAGSFTGGTAPAIHVAASSEYARQPVHWDSNNATATNTNKLVFQSNDLSVYYLTFWFIAPTYSGLTYYGQLPGPPVYLGFMPVAANAFGVAVIAREDGTFTAPRHGLSSGNTVRVDPVFNQKQMPEFTSGVLYTVAVEGVAKPVDQFRLIQNAMQKISMVDGLTVGHPTGGTFVLHFDGHDTTPIGFDAAATDLLGALEALPNVGQGNVTVSGGPGPNKAWVVTFMNALGAQALPVMTSTSSLTGGTSPQAAVTVLSVGGDVVVPSKSMAVFWQQVAPLSFGTISEFTFYKKTLYLSDRGF